MSDGVPDLEVTTETQVVLSAHHKHQPGEGHHGRDGVVGAEQAGLQGGDYSSCKGALARVGQWVEESLSLCPAQAFSEVLEGPCSSLDLDNSNLVGKETAGGQPSC